MKTRKRSAALIGAGAALLPALAVGGTALAGTAGATQIYFTGGNSGLMAGQNGNCFTQSPSDGIRTAGNYQNLEGPTQGVQVVRVYSPSTRCIEFQATYSQGYTGFGNSSTSYGWMKLTGNALTESAPTGWVNLSENAGEYTVEKTQWFNDAGISIGAQASWFDNGTNGYNTPTLDKSTIAPY